MRHRLTALTFVSICVCASVFAADVRDQLVGRWVGDSICTPVRKACHDEKASYRVTKKGDDPKVVAMLLNKIVNGEEVEMGGVQDFIVDAAKQTLTAEWRFKTNHLRIAFHWTGSKMTGTLEDADSGAVVRNITLTKE